jgi:homoserine dehydrogenase
MYYGKGAGAEPTASAVIADLVDVARMLTADPVNRVPYLSFQHGEMAKLSVVPIEDITSGYYLRLRVKDKPGVLADITRALADSQISIDAFFQREPDEGMDETDVILITHLCEERQMRAAMDRIGKLPTVLSEIVMIRMESFA